MTERLSYGDSKKFVQIHLVPASASLFLYLWHGWRQYSKKSWLYCRFTNITIKIKIRLIPLGGIKCFCVHLFKITFPGIVRRLFGLKDKRLGCRRNKDIPKDKGMCYKRKICK